MSEDKRITRNLTNTTEYNAWHSMKVRCSNPNCDLYHRNGGRGIYVCERWIDSFENFYADMGLKPTPEHSLDRIDNDGNYTPDNCRWVTKTEQALNKGNSLVVLDPETGKRITVREASAKYALSRQAVEARIKKGIPLNEGRFYHRKVHHWQGGIYSCQELAEIAGLPPRLVAERVTRGLSIEHIMQSPKRLVNTHWYKDGLYTITEIAAMIGVTPRAIHSYTARGMTAEEAADYIHQGVLTPENAIKLGNNYKTFFYNDQWYCIYGLLHFTDIPRGTLEARLNSGMSVEQAVESPLIKTKTYPWLDGEFSVNQIAKMSNMKARTIRSWLDRGYTVEDTLNIIKPRS